MFPERTGLIVWTHDIKSARNLERFGAVHYVSKKMNYVVLYVNKANVDDTMKQIEKLSYVRKIEPSYRNEIKTEYTSNIPESKTSYHF